MADIDVTRDYRLTDSELSMYCSNLCNFLTRDLSDFAPLGLTAPKIAELKALGDELEVFPTDGSLVGDVMVATEEKNALREKVLATIRAMALRVEQKWGAKSGNYRRLDLRTPSHLNDDGVLTSGRTVHTVVSGYLVQLAEYGLSQDMLDDFQDLNEQFEASRIAQTDAIANRDIKKDERISKGNALYKLITFYCNYGKMIYEKTNPAKYNDYLIYKDSTPGTLTAPQHLIFNDTTKVLWWDVVNHATSYQLQWWNGTDYEVIYSGNANNFTFTPPDGLSKFRVRAHNSGGYGPWSDVL